MNGPYRTEASECDDHRDRVWCPRCEEKRRVIRPWSGWRKARVAWFATMAVILLLAPILAFDYIVMTPTALVIAAAIGPLNHFASMAPTCRTCGWEFAHADVAADCRSVLAVIRRAAVSRTAGRSTEV